MSKLALDDAKGLSKAYSRIGKNFTAFHGVIEIAARRFGGSFASCLPR